jgi:hypothetical protein
MIFSPDSSGRAVDLDACRDMGIAMFAGEAEGRLDMVLRDAATGRFAPVYNFLKDLPGMQGAPVPFLPKRQFCGRSARARVSCSAYLSKSIRFVTRFRTSCRRRNGPASRKFHRAGEYQS